MSLDSGIDYIAWWGAGLSTFLAVVKLVELWQDRFRIDVGYNFTSHPDCGNEIFIRNLGSKPIIITYWEVMEGQRFWPIRKFSSIESPGPDANDLRVEPHSSETFKFTDESHFSWGKGRKIYMRLHIAGKRAILKKVNG